MASSSHTTQISGLVIRTGVPLPPAAGPHRTAMLLRDGHAALAAARQIFGTALIELQSLPVDVLRLAPFNAWQRWPASPFTTAAYPRVGVAWLQARDALRRVPTAEAAVVEAARGGLDQALHAVVDAYNFLEDQPVEATVHALAHAIGELRSGLFGCPLRVEQHRLVQACPLTLLHIRRGMSMGFTARRLCSICRDDLDECEHLLGETYDIRVRRVEGTCTACGSQNCAHQPGQSVQTSPYPVITDIDLHEVSLVSRPRDPLARIREIRRPVPAGKVVRSRPWCLCWRPCDGFSDEFTHDLVTVSPEAVRLGR